MTPPLHPDIHSAAHWLAAQLYHELPEGQADQLKPHAMGWMAAYRIVQTNMYGKSEPHDWLRRTKQQASRYYMEFLRQVHHTRQEQVHHEFILSWALLMACGYFSEPPPPKRDLVSGLFDATQSDYLRVEAYHFGHYVNLIDAVHSMLHDEGRQVTGFSYHSPFVPLLEPFLSPN